MSRSRKTWILYPSRNVSGSSHHICRSRDHQWNSSLVGEHVRTRIISGLPAIREITTSSIWRGKVVESVEVDHDLQAIIILFQDKISLRFKIDLSYAIVPEPTD